MMLQLPTSKQNMNNMQIKNTVIINGVESEISQNEVLKLLTAVNCLQSCVFVMPIIFKQKITMKGVSNLVFLQ